MALGEHEGDGAEENAECLPPTLLRADSPTNSNASAAGAKSGQACTFMTSGGTFDESAEFANLCSTRLIVPMLTNKASFDAGALTQRRGNIVFEADNASVASADRPEVNGACAESCDGDSACNHCGRGETDRSAASDGSLPAPRSPSGTCCRKTAHSSKKKQQQQWPGGPPPSPRAEAELLQSDSSLGRSEGKPLRSALLPGAVPAGTADATAESVAERSSPSLAPAKRVRMADELELHRLPSTWKEKVYALLDPGMPAWSARAIRGQQAISIGIFLVIIVSVTCFCIESLPQFYEEESSSLARIETCCIWIFTLEFCLRLYTVKHLRKFSKDPLNWIDLLSIIPWYVALAVDEGGAGSLVVLRVIRLIRVFRVLKLSKYSTNLQLVAIAMARSVDALSLLLFLIIICLLMFSSAMFLAEQSDMRFDKDADQWLIGDTAQIAPFQSIPSAFWWCLVTLTTVGYGNETPISTLGRCVAAVTMLCSILVSSFPVILIGNNFNQAVAEHRAKAKRQAELVQRAFGKEVEPPDEAPTIEDCRREVGQQLTAFRSELQKTLVDANICSMAALGGPQTKYELPIGTVCSHFLVEASATYHSVIITSYGNGTAKKLSAPPPKPAPRFSVASVKRLGFKYLIRKFNERSQEVLRAQQIKDSASSTFQFRYEPVPAVISVTSTAPHYPRTICVKVALDSQGVRQRASWSLRATGNYPSIEDSNVCAREIDKLTGAIPGLALLAPLSQVFCQCHRPPNIISVNVVSPDADTYALVNAFLTELHLQLEVSFLYSCPGQVDDMTYTILLRPTKMMTALSGSFAYVPDVEEENDRRRSSLASGYNVQDQRTSVVSLRRANPLRVASVRFPSFDFPLEDPPMPPLIHPHPHPNTADVAIAVADSDARVSIPET